MTVASGILALRSADGSNAIVSYTPGIGPGVWQPTPPGFLPAAFPQWATLTPFTMTSNSQFRPAGAPDLSSDAYTAAFNEVKECIHCMPPLKYSCILSFSFHEKV